MTFLAVSRTAPGCVCGRGSGSFWPTSASSTTKVNGVSSLCHRVSQLTAARVPRHVCIWCVRVSEIESEQEQLSTPRLWNFSFWRPLVIFNEPPL